MSWQWRIVYSNAWRSVCIKFEPNWLNIEKVIENLDKKKYTVPENWMFAEARRLFINPDVTPAEEFDFKWEKPDIEGLVQYIE